MAAACSQPRSLTPAAQAGGEHEKRAEALVVQSRWAQALRVLDEGVARARARGDRAGEATLLLARGRARNDQIRHRGGDPAPALADLEAGRRLAEEAGDQELTALAADAAGMQRYTTWFSSQKAEDLAAADRMFRRALALRAPRGDAPVLADSEFHVGLVHQMRGEREQARSRFEAALRIAERLRDPLRASYALRHLGYMAQLRGDARAAEDGYRRSFELRERAGAGIGVGAALLTLTEFRYERDGDAERAWPHLARALAVSEQVGSAPYAAKVQAAMGRVRRDQARYDEALRHFTAAVAAMDRIGSDEDVPESLEQMALLHLLRGDPAAAAAPIGRALAGRPTPRLAALAALVRARGGAVAPAAAPADTGDGVVAARLALAAGRAGAALESALAGDEPDTLALAAQAAARAGRADALERARVAAAALSRAQELRFARLAGSSAAP